MDLKSYMRTANIFKTLGGDPNCRVQLNEMYAILRPDCMNTPEKKNILSQNQHIQVT